MQNDTLNKIILFQRIFGILYFFTKQNKKLKGEFMKKGLKFSSHCVISAT